MLGWKKLTCAVDLSEPSRVAMEYAVDLASRFAAELTLVHVHAPLYAGDTVVPSSKGSASLAAAERTLEQWRAEAEERVRAPVRSKILFGEAVAEVLRYDSENGCDLLIVGTHGRGGIPRLVLGSVAEHLIRQSHCPVLVARDGVRLANIRDVEEIAQYR